MTAAVAAEGAAATALMTTAGFRQRILRSGGMREAFNGDVLDR